MLKCAKIREMGLFRKKKKKGTTNDPDAAALALRSLDFIAEAVLVVNPQGIIKFANPAAAAMTGYGDPSNMTGLDYQLVMHLENSQQVPIDPSQSTLYTAIHLNQSLNTRDYVLVAAQNERRICIDLSCIPTGDLYADRIITFRDITTELAEEREQAEFISTASHEMRTPVASIEGYLGLCLNPQTATIDDRARQYLDAAHTASKHLGRLFKDLLDVTKFDDSRAKAHLIPVDAVQAVSYIANEQAEAMQAKNLRYSFGGNRFSDKKHLTQKIYMAVDYDFLHEIVDNLVGNAIKYTPEGGEIKVNVKGDGDKVLITVADTGIGIPAEDIGHIFQKFYRVDNTHTREIGGTGLGLYLVKQRAESLGGRVWAESDFGHGSTFFVSLPRITESEYEKMRIAYGNEKMMRTPFVAPVVGTATITVPPAGLTATANGQTGAQIQMATSATPAVPASAPATPTNISAAPTDNHTPVSASSMPEPAPANVSAPTISPLIKTHAMTLQEPSSSDNPEVASATEPQIFARKAPTLMPHSTPTSATPSQAASISSSQASPTTMTPPTSVPTAPSPTVNSPTNNQ